MGERRRKSGRRMEKTLWVRDVERVGEEWRKRMRGINYGHVKYPDLTGMAQWHADLGFWSCDRSHMIGEVAGPDHGHQ